MRVLIAYDISRDGARAHASAILQQWGDRIQKSVFLCHINPVDLRDVMTRIERIIDFQTDALMALPVCATCHDKVTFLGQYHETPASPCWVVV